MSDLNFQQFSTVQDNLMLPPATIVAATTIAPTTFITLLTGTTSVATITPPVTGSHMLCVLATDSSPGATVTTGNIILATTVVKNKALFLVYEPISAKYYPSY